VAPGIIKIRYIDVSKNELKINVKNFLNVTNKYKNDEDKMLSYASELLKKSATYKYYSISHSYPFVAIAECDKQIGIDIENANRFINWNKITRRFNKTDAERINDRDHFLHIWTIKEAYFKISQDYEYLSIPMQTLWSQTNIHIFSWNIIDLTVSVCINDKKSSEYSFDEKMISLKSLVD